MVLVIEKVNTQEYDQKKHRKKHKERMLWVPCQYVSQLVGPHPFCVLIKGLTCCGVCNMIQIHPSNHQYL